MKQSYFLKPYAVVAVTVVVGGFSTALPAHSENQSSEMRDLVRQSKGLSVTKHGSETESGKRTEPSAATDFAAIYIQAGASTEQAEKIRDIRKGFNSLSEIKAKEAMALYKEMRSLTTQAELDETKILSVQEKINALQSDMAMEKTKTLIAVRKLLTPKQRENLVAIIHKRSNAQPESAH